MSNSELSIEQVVVTTQQLDLALLGVLSAETAGVFVVRYMLSKKQFVSKHDIEQGTPLLTRGDV